MDKEKVRDVVERYRMALQRQGVRCGQIVLFGSHANGTQRDDSDIDLVVVSSDFEGKDFWERIELLSKGIVEVWEPIEAIAMTPVEWETGASMIGMFAREGEVAYSAA